MVHRGSKYTVKIALCMTDTDVVVTILVINDGKSERSMVILISLGYNGEKTTI